MAEFEKIPEKRDKILDFQSKYNSASKSVAHMLGTNMALFICILLPVFLVGSIWTEFGAPEFGVKLLSDGVVTVALFAVGETLMMRVGADGGKLDPEYVDAKKEFDRLVKEVNEIGTMLLATFCSWQIDVELRNARSARIRALRMTSEEYAKAKESSYAKLVDKYGDKKAKQIVEVIRLEPIELNEAMLLYDNTPECISRGGVPISAEKYMHNKKRYAIMLIRCAFTGLLTVSVAMTITSDITYARVIYTVFKLIVLLSRMASGYATGAKAYNTIEARQLTVKSNYLRQYIRFVNDKTYLKIGDRYGVTKCFSNDETTANANTAKEPVKSKVAPVAAPVPAAAKTATA